MLALGVACGGAGGDLTVEAARAADAGPPAGCSTDADCPVGLVCEGCETAPRQCVPGCRTDAQCPAHRICRLGVVCNTCPCAPGWCDLDPCRDVDGDGYVQSTDPDLVCPTRRGKGDCNDANPRQHPGRAERCGNYIDDDCDGQWDEDCPTCAGTGRCSDSVSCGQGRTCTNSCCAPCPSYSPPLCQPHECLIPTAAPPDGCGAPPTCGACASCPAVDEPVCGTNAATYGNRCLAQAAGVAVLHGGPCLAREGAACDLSRGLTFCSNATYCRALCEDCDGICTALGSCFQDSDCRPPAYEPSADCVDGGTATGQCVDHECRTRCAP